MGSRRTKKITEESLHEAALSYLERYVASSTHLHQVLMRRVRRAARDQEVDVEAAREWVDQIVRRFNDVGLLDDESFARGQAKRLLRRGTSLRGVRARLVAKGVAGEVIDGAIDDIEEEEPEPELAAAVAYARRRRFGPFGSAPEGLEDRRERRRKELAAMARAGFSFDVAQKVVEAEDLDELIPG